MINIYFISTSEELIFIVLILMYSDIDINPNGSSRLYVILLSSRSMSACFILGLFPLLIDSTILKARFLGHIINSMLNLLVNSLNIISLSNFSNKSSTIFNSFGLMFNDFSSLKNLFITVVISEIQILSVMLSSIFFSIHFYSFIWSTKKLLK